MGSEHYVKEAIRNVENWLEEQGSMIEIEAQGFLSLSKLGNFFLFDKRPRFTMWWLENLRSKIYFVTGCGQGRTSRGGFESRFKYSIFYWLYYTFCLKLRILITFPCIFRSLYNFRHCVVFWFPAEIKLRADSFVMVLFTKDLIRYDSCELL